MDGDLQLDHGSMTTLVCVYRLLSYFITLLWVLSTYFCWVNSNTEETMKCGCFQLILCLLPSAVLVEAKASQQEMRALWPSAGYPQGGELESRSSSKRRAGWPLLPPRLWFAFLSAVIFISLCKLGSSSMPFFNLYMLKIILSLSVWYTRPYRTICTGQGEQGWPWVTIRYNFRLREKLQGV